MPAMSGALAAGASHLIGRLESRPSVIGGAVDDYGFAPEQTSCVTQRLCLSAKSMNNNNNNNSSTDCSSSDCGLAHARTVCSAGVTVPATVAVISPPSPSPPPPPPLAAAAAAGGGGCGSGEGGGSSPSAGAATPPCIRWATGLHVLLDDKDGVEHFQTFLNEEGCSDMLKFWFACQGLKHQPSGVTGCADQSAAAAVDQQTRRLIVAMYRRFIRRPPGPPAPPASSSSAAAAAAPSAAAAGSSQLPLSEPVREQLCQLVASGAVHARMFDAAQREIELVMERTLYPNFLQSDYYIELVQQQQQLQLVTAAAGDAPAAAAAAPVAADHNGAAAAEGVVVAGMAAVKLEDDEVDNDNDDEEEVGVETGSCGSGASSCASGGSCTPYRQHLTTAAAVADSAVAGGGQASSRDQLLTSTTGVASRMLPPAAPVCTLTAAAAGGSGGVQASPLTRDSLLRSQRCRSRLPPRPLTADGAAATSAASAAAGGGGGGGGGGGVAAVNPYHTLYSSYNPVSRQDSELQSMSSEATTLTDDNASSLDGCRGGRGPCPGAAVPVSSSARLSYRRHHRRQQRLIKQSARANHEPVQHRGLLIPRAHPTSGTVGGGSVHANPTIDCHGFARLLTARLEQVIIDKQMSDRSGESRSVLQDTLGKLATRFSEQNDQEILDAHISKVFESSHQTPQQQLSGTHSPSCQQLPLAARTAAAAVQLHHHRHHISHHQQPPPPPLAAGGGGAGHLPRSGTFPLEHRSLPACVPAHGATGRRPMASHHHQQQQHGSVTVTGAGVLATVARAIDVDSGVSLVSVETGGGGGLGGGGVGGGGSDGSMSQHQHYSLTAQQTRPVDKVLSWMHSTERSSSAAGLTHPTDHAHSSGLSRAVSAATSASSSSSANHLHHHHHHHLHHANPQHYSPHQRQQLQQQQQQQQLASNSDLLPDPSRSYRLGDFGGDGGVIIGGGSLKRHPKQQQQQLQQRSSSGYRYTDSGVAAAAAPATTAAAGGSGGGGEVLCIAYTFCGDPVPYRTRVPGASITLRQFKQLLPRKGHYRYFFKTACTDFESGVIQEEVADECAQLPLWEGKVHGQVMARD